MFNLIKRISELDNKQHYFWGGLVIRVRYRSVLPLNLTYSSIATVSSDAYFHLYRLVLTKENEQRCIEDINQEAKKASMFFLVKVKF